jgi:hypothetical protein
VKVVLKVVLLLPVVAGVNGMRWKGDSMVNSS